MAVVRNRLNFGLAEVSDEYAKDLIESGQWESADAPVRKRRTHKPAPAEAPTEE